MKGNENTRWKKLTKNTVLRELSKFPNDSITKIRVAGIKSKISSKREKLSVLYAKYLYYSPLCE